MGGAPVGASYFAPRTIEAMRAAGDLRDATMLSVLAWRLVCGRSSPDALVFPADHGAEWSANGLEKWRQRRFSVFLAAADVADGRPYHLRATPSPHLLLHERRDVIYVAREIATART